MPQPISAESAQNDNLAANSSRIEPPDEGNRTALECLAWVATHHGIDLSGGRLKHTYAIGQEAVSQAMMLRMAKKAGLRARITKADWQTSGS